MGQIQISGSFQEHLLVYLKAATLKLCLCPFLHLPRRSSGKDQHRGSILEKGVRLQAAEKVGMASGHGNKPHLSTAGKGAAKREECARRMQAIKQRERREEEGRDEVRRGRKVKEQEEIRGRREQE